MGGKVELSLDLGITVPGRLGSQHHWILVKVTIGGLRKLWKYGICVFAETSHIAHDVNVTKTNCTTNIQFFPPNLAYDKKGSKVKK